LCEDTTRTVDTARSMRTQSPPCGTTPTPNTPRAAPQGAARREHSLRSAQRGSTQPPHHERDEAVGVDLAPIAVHDGRPAASPSARAFIRSKRLQAYTTDGELLDEGLLQATYVSATIHLVGEGCWRGLWQRLWCGVMNGDVYEDVRRGVVCVCCVTAV